MSQSNKSPVFTDNEGHSSAASPPVEKKRKKIARIDDSEGENCDAAMDNGSGVLANDKRSLQQIGAGASRKKPDSNRCPDDEDKNANALETTTIMKQVSPGETPNSKELDKPDALTPYPTITSFEDSIQNMLTEHQARLKSIRNNERASNLEFLGSVEHFLFGESLFVDNNLSTEPVFVNGKDCMQLPAGKEPFEFGRELGKFIFGENRDCQLITHMIGPKRNHSDMRSRVSPDLETAFESLFLISYYIYSPILNTITQK